MTGLDYQIVEDTRHQVPGPVGKQPYYCRQVLDAEFSRRLFYKVLSQYGRRQQATVYAEDGKSSKVDRQHRHTHAYNYMTLGGLASDADALATASIKDIAATEYGVQVAAIHQPQVLGYEEGCVFNCHSDTGTPVDGGWKPSNNHRDFTSILWLNDCVEYPSKPHEFSGGQLELDNLRTSSGSRMIVVPKAGLLLVMPSHPVYRHSVAPITRGYRVAFVNWWRIVT